ncbi:TolC family protein [Erythrobacter litoralis]|uniref:TolC family protein n=1 Tax=Erythrobacter litoralis TaxID=39960 RepID=UPI002435DD0E|nr:TolC family protein [Erythrobacter litoralis]MDG6080239.1 TolC family protein [Erythrobacter litoralis]
MTRTWRFAAILSGAAASAFACPVAAQTIAPDASILTQDAPPADPVDTAPPPQSPLDRPNTAPEPVTAAPSTPSASVSDPEPVLDPVPADPMSATGPVESPAPMQGPDLDPDLQAQGVTDLPEPVAAPLDIDFAGDPVLALADSSADADTFRAIVVAALEDSPTTREALALEDAAEARVTEARSGLLPVIDMNVASFRTFDRQFTDDPQNLIERSRPRRRTDFTLQLVQPVWDFGGALASTRAASARLRAAGFQREARVGEVAGEMVIAWTQVFGYQALERLYEGFLSAQDGLDDAIDRRIALGVSAEGDRSRVASLRAQGAVQLAQARRQLSGAEARFRLLSGFEPPARLMRPPMLGEGDISLDWAQAASQDIPEVRTYEELAKAREQDARAAKARRLPNVTGRVDYGRYGFLEDRIDYDLRGTINLGWRFFGGGVWARARAADADADAAIAVADRVREEAARDAAIAWSDVQALEAQVAALEEAYRAARQSRDIVVARFGALRGTLFDVADSQSIYLNAAGSYIRALAELDAARYILILRTGRMSELLEIEETEIPL